MAESIHAAAQGRPSIVMCPNSVEIAKIVAYHLCGAAGNKNAAQPVYGAQGDEADDLMKAYKKGDFPYIVAVKKLEKGFDHDEVRCLFMLRKTKSRRMYEQFLGRGARPLVGIRAALNDAAGAEERKRIIAESAKPYFVFFDLVGVHPSAKDLGVIDILGSKILNEREREKVKENQLEDGFCDDGESLEDPNDIGDDARKAREDVKAEVAEERKKNEEEERKRRHALEIQATTLVQITDDFGVDAVRQRMTINPTAVTEKQAKLLIAFGANPKTVAKMSKRQAGAVIQSYTDKDTKPQWSRVRQWERQQYA
jgi:superfamily II DNA or RNA helicase